jgi:hypothetical protein
MSHVRDGLAVVLLVAVLAGCGSHAHSSKSLTIPAYGEHPATTERITQGSPAFCRADARSFARAAVLFVGHSGPNASYPADLYYMNIRGIYVDFVAHQCSPAYLGPPLSQKLTPAQRQKLVAYLPHAMAATIRRGLRTSR